MKNLRRQKPWLWMQRMAWSQELWNQPLGSWALLGSQEPSILGLVLVKPTDTAMELPLQPRPTHLQAVWARPQVAGFVCRHCWNHLLSLVSFLSALALTIASSWLHSVLRRPSPSNVLRFTPGRANLPSLTVGQRHGGNLWGGKHRPRRHSLWGGQHRPHGRWRGKRSSSSR